MSFLHLHKWILGIFFLHYTSQHTIFTDFGKVSSSENLKANFPSVRLYHHDSLPAWVKVAWFCSKEHGLHCRWSTNNFYSSHVFVFLEWTLVTLLLFLWKQSDTGCYSLYSPYTLGFVCLWCSEGLPRMAEGPFFAWYSPVFQSWQCAD